MPPLTKGNNDLVESAASMDGALFSGPKPIMGWRLCLVMLDECIMMAFCVLTIIAAAERSMPEFKQKEEAEKTGEKPPSDPIPTFQLDASLFLVIPISFSASLLLFFFFFSQLEFIMAIYISAFTMVAVAFSVQPICSWLSYVLCGLTTASVGFPVLGEVAVTTLISSAVGVFAVLAWLVTAHWILLDVLGIALVIWMLCHIKLPSIRVATALFVSLMIYDVFWVFFSERIFHKNVMMDVAMKQASNPVGVIANKVGLPEVAKSSPKIMLPGKFVMHGIFSDGSGVLGLGDVFIPGLIACFTRRFDHTLQCIGRERLKKNRVITYFNCSLLGFCAGMLMSTLAVLMYGVAQPALLYIVPTSIIPLLLVSIHHGETSALWHGDCSHIQVFPVHRT
eukprot:scpid57760/ scgid6411/ Signal peptide peptidase-like 3; Intramembrane protease 2; Presenilin homologous protein 1; Presenilin-like protein 4